MESSRILIMKHRLLNTVNWKKYLIPGTSKRVDNFLDENGTAVYQQVTDRVCRAIKTEQEKLVVIVHPNAGNAIVINDYEYNEFLDIANEWFLKIEDYRMCGKIKTYSIMNSKRTKKSKRTLKVSNGLF
tara:strand:- start:2295 stop:2681 length:387 start_codon:yes stop_codon:yes gene_type:complete